MRCLFFIVINNRSGGAGVLSRLEASGLAGALGGTGDGMKVTGIRTIRLPEHPQMLWLQVLTDEGITGLGETCLGPATVEAHLHETGAPYLIGQDPGRIAAHRRGLYDLFVGYEGPGAEPR